MSTSSMSRTCLRQECLWHRADSRFHEPLRPPGASSLHFRLWACQFGLASITRVPDAWSNLQSHLLLCNATALRTKHQVVVLRQESGAPARSVNLVARIVCYIVARAIRLNPQSVSHRTKYRAMNLPAAEIIDRTEGDRSSNDYDTQPRVDRQLVKPSRKSTSTRRLWLSFSASSSKRATSSDRRLPFMSYLAWRSRRINPRFSLC